MSGSGRIRFQLFTKSADIDREGIVIHIVAASVPERFQNGIARQRAARVADEKAQKPVFSGRQIQRLTVSQRTAVGQINGDGPGNQQSGIRSGPDPAAPQESPDP